MKTKTFIIAAIVATTLFASCAKEKTSELGEGNPTFMGLSFTFPAGSTPTKASSDDNANAAETAFVSVDVFIYNSSTGTQTTHKRLLPSDFTGETPGTNADVWTMKAEAKIATTTGPKTVIVGVNLPLSLSNSLVDVAFPYVAQTIAVANITGSTDGFAMFSTEPVQINLIKDPDFGAKQNYPTVQVQRMVAKVTVQKDEYMSIVGSGYLTDLRFELNNTNKKTFYIQPADKKDHNWATTPGAGDDALNGLNSTYIPVDEYNVSVKSLAPKYCLENTTRDFLMSQITRATVRGTFVPNEVKEYENGTDKNNGYVDMPIASGTTPVTFYSVTYNAGTARAYFFDPLVAADFAADHGGTTVLEYANGYCYWDIYLNPDNAAGPYNVLRNDFYRCNIIKIMAPGRPTPEVADPTLPPTASTDIMVDIEMLHWNPIVKNYILD